MKEHDQFENEAGPYSDPKLKMSPAQRAAYEADEQAAKAFADKLRGKHKGAT